MMTLLLRRRYLTAMGLSSCILGGCSATERGTTPVVTTTPTTAATETTIATSVPTATETAVATETPPTAKPVPTAATTTAEWEPHVLPKPVADPGPPEPPMPRPPSCPSGAFCIAESKAKGKGEPMAEAPFRKCATSMNPPGPRSSGERSTMFDKEQTARERTETKDACCYTWVIPCPGGRPLIVDGAPRVAGEIASAEWISESATWVEIAAGLPDVSARCRELLAEHYAREAAFEHASIASFSRVSLSLLGVGAPPDLIADTHRAGLDEIAHASAMYRLASAWHGAAIGPTALDVSGAGSVVATLAAIAEEAFAEGCVGEVAAALVLREEVERAGDASTRDALAAMAADEERHAELAWRTVAWAFSRDPSAVRPVLDRARLAYTAESATDVPPETTEPLPFVTQARERALIRRRAVSEIVLPCLDALLERGEA